MRGGGDAEDERQRWDIWRAVFAPQPDQATQVSAQAAFAHQARVAGGEVVHDRTYPKDGAWHGDSFVVCTGYAAERLGTWKEVKRIRPAK